MVEQCRNGGIGRHKGLKIPRMNNPCQFNSGFRQVEAEL